MLKRMRRNYTREAYLDLVSHIRETVPGVTLSTDVIVGFCGETEQEHEDTVSLMERVAYDEAFMYAYRLVVFLFLTYRLLP
jgi:tRNA-2-methylthio-N6-dimethylallyladenosine synthase